MYVCMYLDHSVRYEYTLIGMSCTSTIRIQILFDPERRVPMYVHTIYRLFS